MADVHEVPLSEKRYVSVNLWVSLTGMSRVTVYRRLAAGEMRAIKLGRSTLIDVQHALAWMATLPVADIRTGRAAEPAQSFAA